MNDFTAENGMIVGLIPTSDVWTVNPLNEHGEGYVNLTQKQMQALREFSRAEEDARLGRWRWPGNPDITVRPSNRESWVGVVKDDPEGRAYGQFYRGDPPTVDPMSRAARAYFDAHPEPKPWHDAVEGEVWILMFRNSSHAWFVNGDYFQSTKTLTNIAKTDDGIIAGRRIFPEEVAS